MQVAAQRVGERGHDDRAVRAVDQRRGLPQEIAQQEVARVRAVVGSPPSRRIVFEAQPFVHLSLDRARRFGGRLLPRRPRAGLFEQRNPRILGGSVAAEPRLVRVRQQRIHYMLRSGHLLPSALIVALPLQLQLVLAHALVCQRVTRKRQSRARGPPVSERHRDLVGIAEQRRSALVDGTHFHGSQ